MAVTESYSFPTRLTEGERFFVNFDFFKLEAPLKDIEGSIVESITSGNVSINMQDTLGDIMRTFDYSKSADELLATIQLPLQEAPSEGSSLEYGDQSAKTLTNISTAVRTMGGAAGGGGGFILGALVKAMAPVAQAELIPEVVGATASRLQGRAKNTMQQTFFVGPNKRDYSFNFELIARNHDDSKKMSEIANRFQYYSNPGLEGTGNFWTYPDVVRFFFMERNAQTDKITKIDMFTSSENKINDKYYESKACFITSVGIEYGDDEYLKFSTPQGRSGHAKLKLTISLKEAEYFTKADYA